MVDFEFTKKFEKQYNGLSKELKKLTVSKLKLLEEDIKHASLRVKKIKATESLHEASINKNYRIIFTMSKDTITLLYIDTHDALDKKKYKNLE